LTRNFILIANAQQVNQIQWVTLAPVVSIKCSARLFFNSNVETIDSGGTVVGVFSYPKHQIFFTVSLGRSYVYSTGLVLRALKVQSRAFRRQNSGYRMYFLFLLKKLKVSGCGKDFILVINSLRGWGVLKRYYTPLGGVGVRNWLLLNPMFNFKKLGLKKLTSIKRRLRKKFIVE